MTRTLPVLALVLSLSAVASAQCHTTVKEAQKQVSWSGSAGEIAWTANQPDCKANKTVDWVAISVTPPTSAGAGVLRYSVDTNFSTSPRSANIQLGDASIEISQAGGPRPGMAFSPGRIEIQISPDQIGKDINKPIFVGSDEPLACTAKLAEPADWVKVSGGNPNPQRHLNFMVTVKTDQFRPGKAYLAKILLEAPAASNATETIPVIVRVDPPEAK